MTLHEVRRGHLLLVDDDAMVLNCVQRMLSRESDVVALTSAREALALIAAGERFDLILCDLMMPEMTGMDLHLEIVKLDQEQANRMIFVTGGAFTDEARKFLSRPRGGAHGAHEPPTGDAHRGASRTLLIPNRGAADT